MSNGSPTPMTGSEFSAAPMVIPVPKPVTGPLTAEELITLNEEIAAMAKAGLPLDQGLSVLAKEMGHGRLQKVTQQIAADLRAGMTLPQALDKQKGAVPPYYAALLAAGIRAGKLGEVLGTLTLYARAIADFRATVFGALLYPTMVMILGIVLLAFVGGVILPSYVHIFQEMRMQLPLITRAIIFVGQHPIEILIVPPIGIALGLIVMRFGLRSNTRGRMIWARFVNALPIVGGLIRSARLAAFADLLGLLVDQSVPLPEALRLASEASSDTLLCEGGKKVEEELRQGSPLWMALHRQRLVPELVIWMINFGERQGTLGTSLHQLAQMYRRQADVRATLLRTVLPPLLVILFSGTLVGLFVFGVLAPMFALMEGLAGGFK